MNLLQNEQDLPVEHIACKKLYWRSLLNIFIKQQSDIEYLRTDLLIQLSENEESKKNIVERKRILNLEFENRKIK